jgi:excinuclease ABC subunit C
VTDPASYRPAPGAIPTTPGVYRFRDPHGRVVYVGKAKNLRSRVSSYFQDPAALHPRTRAMVTTAASVEWTVVRSEVEALVLEHTWIQEFDPRYNVVFKDDKSYPFLAVTMSDEIPRVYVTRDARQKGTRYFGPYAKVWAIRETVDTLLTVLPMRSCTAGTFARAKRSDRPCLLGYIEKCSAPCVGRVTAGEHRELAEQVCAVLAGDAKALVRDLTRQMDAASNEERFEAAARLRDRLAALTAVLDRNAMVLASGVDADVVGIEDDEYEAAAHVFHVRDGRITGQRAWVVDKPEPLGTAELVTRLVQEIYDAPGAPAVPSEILVPSVPADAAALVDWLAGLRGGAVAVKVPARGAKAELAGTSHANAVETLAHHRLKRASDLTARSAALTALQEALGLPEAPLRIECYDISHTGGTNQAASMVVFEDALPRKREYRHFSVLDARDDTEAMAQVITRRFTRYLEEAGRPVEERDSSRFAYPPQLVVVDGAGPQVEAAHRALTALGVQGVSLCGLAKRLEEVWLPGDSFPVILPRGSEALYLLQRVRDEAHRFAIRQHRSRRSRAMTASQVDQIPGVGPARARALLRHFGSLDKVREASVDQIALVPGIGRETAGAIFQAVSGKGGMLEA